MTADGDEVLKKLKDGARRKRLVSALARVLWEDEREHLQRERDRRIRR